MTTINVFNPAKGNKWLCVEMVRQRRTDGELEISRNGMEYVLGILTHLNNASGSLLVPPSLREEYEELHLSTRRVQIEAGSSPPGGELTRNSVLVTPDSEPSSRDS
ncbi:hypothetical protein ACFXDJ_03060 [Streptomyces sp. NPDC059443]|uniref:hypothetical protein n=1 Tax=unclassified Streptomyces TaxID=2593676 RepID=UPI0036ABDD2B